ncbi:hypothetical protein AHAS_Ahas17G0236600 [Arachis hypogaea]
MLFLINKITMMLGTRICLMLCWIQHMLLWRKYVQIICKMLCLRVAGHVLVELEL